MMYARPSSPLPRVHTLNTAVLPQLSGPTSIVWLQLWANGNAPLMLAMFTAHLPPWTRNESRPKNTVGRSAIEVSQPVGIHGCWGSPRSKPGFWSSERPSGFAASARWREAESGSPDARRVSADRTAARSRRQDLGMLRIQ